MLRYSISSTLRPVNVAFALSNKSHELLREYKCFLRGDGKIGTVIDCESAGTTVKAFQDLCVFCERDLVMALKRCRA